MPLITQPKQISSFPVGLKVPPNYPMRPAPNKISILFNYNSTDIYHKLSPYTTYDNFFGVTNAWPLQPFIYTYPDQTQTAFTKMPTVVSNLLEVAGINQSAVNDVVRITKFTAWNFGLFTIKQLGLQRLQPFDETRVYNPLSPLLATVNAFTLGLAPRPTRHIEGGFFGGLLNSITSVVGINYQNGFQTPKSTAGSGALSKFNGGQGKGLIRGETATTAFAKLNTVWVKKTNPLTGVSALVSSLKDAFKSAFGTPSQPKGTIFRADETTYQLMVSDTDRLITYSKTGVQLPATSSWIAGVKVYGTTLGVLNEGGSSGSMMLDNYSLYDNHKNIQYVTKFSDPLAEKVKQQILDMNLLMFHMNTKDEAYSIKSYSDSMLMPDGFGRKVLGYDRIPENVDTLPKGKYGVGTDYSETVIGGRPVDRTFNANNLKMATTFNSDGLNQIGVLNKDKKISVDGGLNDTHPNWVEYQPYKDDLIAFFFYDVVNQKYIPFRATVKGISESGTAFWDELRFIGRSDQLYSYNGFSRTLSFSFNIVIGSVMELLPTWQKINYIASCVKPSSYTSGRNGLENRYSKFIVPPMFMITIGDMYNYQPVVITSVTTNVPDDAAWETLNVNNTPLEWSFLNGIIKSPKLGFNYAQVPREVEISITCNLLEKERSLVGGSNFGHAPRVDDWETVAPGDIYLTGDGDMFPTPTEFNKNTIVLNGIEKTSSAPKKTSPNNSYPF